MARGKLRIRQRGSRQQWARVRDVKTFGPDDQPEPDSEALKLLSGSDIVKTVRCGLCARILEQTLRDGRTTTTAAYAACITCEEVRCADCVGADDDPCVDDAEHEYASDGSA
jgi:hypothetical protein